MIIREKQSGDEWWGAEFSPCKRYRYRLWREWDATLPNVVFCLMNPSTADEIENDPTIERQTRRVARWVLDLDLKVGRVDVVNVFAYRETYSKKLHELYSRGHDLIGPENDAAILRACENAELVICGWGSTGELGNRGQNVYEMLRTSGVVPHAFRMNFDGSPSHPGRLAYDLLPVPMDPRDSCHPKMRRT